MPLSNGRRWLPSAAALLALGFIHGTAHADLWAYVDAQGGTHFAADQLNERYALYAKGGYAAQLNLTAESRLGSVPQGASESTGLRATGSQQPGFSLPKRFAAINESQAYKSVQKHIETAARTHAVDYELIKAVIAAESGFDASAVSPKGAVGLMQLLPSTAQMYGVSADTGGRKDGKGKAQAARSVKQKLTDPHTNIHAGARYLAYLLKLFKGDTALAVAAYNAGEGAVQRAGNKVPNYKETQGYVRTVMALYNAFKPGAEALGSSGGRTTRASTPRSGGRTDGRVRIELPAAVPSIAGRTESVDATRPAAEPGVTGGYVPVVWR